jgi:DNA-binding IclR family transcriptional regulator
MMMAKREQSGDIQVLARTSQILRALEPGGRIQLGQLANELNVGRSTLHRYLVSMANLDMVTRVGDGEYVLGPLLAQLGAVSLNRERVIDAASAASRLLCDRIEETVVLSVWGGSGAVVSVVNTPESLIQVVVRVGSTLPIDAAQTQVFLAHLPQSSVDRMLDGVPERAAIERTFGAIRDEGYLPVAGFVEGLETVAAPVFDASGIVATIAVIGTEARMAGSRRSMILDDLLSTVASISTALGYQKLQKMEVGVV